MKSDWHWISGATDENDVPSKSFFRSPLLWILLPQMAAYTLCECGFALPPKSCVVAGIIALILSAASFLGEFSSKHFKGKFKDVWLFCLPISVFFLGGAWWSVNAPEKVDWGNYPETEVVAELRIETPFRSAGKSWSGIARVESVPDDCAALKNARIFYQFRKSETSSTPLEGMRLRLRGLAHDISEDSWFSEDFREFLRSRQVSVRIGNSDSVEFLKSGISALTTAWFAQQKADLIQKLVDSKSSREREQRILAALLLGEQKLIPPDQEKDFMLTGTMHIFAVSGLHISFFAVLCFWIFSKIRFPYLIAASLTLVITWFYVQLTGAAPSAMRAWMMVVFLLAARIFGRTSHPLNALVLAASVALWENPSLLNFLGFQLSYGVVASIFLYGIPLTEALNSRLQFFKYIPQANLSYFRRFARWSNEKLIGLFSVSLGTFFAGAAFISGSFEIFTPIAILVNLILVPCTGILLGTAIVAAVFFCIPATEWLAKILWAMNCAFMFAIEVVTGTAAEIPADFKTTFSYSWQGILGGGLTLFFFALGAFWEPLRSRPLLRFTFPPAFLCAYLLAFAS